MRSFWSVRSGASLFLSEGSIRCKSAMDGSTACGCCFCLWFMSNPALAVIDWNTGPWESPLRYWLAGPLLLIGGGLTTWGWVTLGSKNSSGLRDGFVARGPYAITRNPQYLGDFFIFTGFAIAANSGVGWVTHLLTALVFLLAPAAEEPWLEHQYGDEYVRYRRSVARFL